MMNEELNSAVVILSGAQSKYVLFACPCFEMNAVLIGDSSLRSE